MTEPASEPQVRSATASTGIVFTLSIDDVGAQMVAARVLEKLDAAVQQLDSRSFNGRVS